MTRDELLNALQAAVGQLSAISQSVHQNERPNQVDVVFRLSHGGRPYRLVTVERNGTVVIAPAPEHRLWGPLSDRWHDSGIIERDLRIEGWPADLERTCPRCGGGGTI